MMKRAVGLVLALAVAMNSAVVGFAQSGSSKTKSAQQDIIEYAEEHEDPQLGRYYDSLEEESTDSDFTTFGYSNSSITHSSEFDDMEKVWGIDVSYYQYDIDWDEVKDDGIDFAIIRVGYRGYGSAGTLVLDTKFKENIEGAIDAGLEVGVYFYTQAITTTEAKEEADFVLKYISSYDLDLPVYFDIESVDYATGRLDSAGLTKSEKTKLCEAFCDRIEDNGYEAGVYANKYWLTSMIDGEALGEEYKIWVAQYNTECTYTGTYQTWQFTGSGSISGIDTSVDIDVDYREDTSKVSAPTIYTTVTDSTVKISWDKVSGATKYIVYRKMTDGTYNKLGETTSTSYSLERKSSWTSGTISYCVRAVKQTSSKTYYSSYSNVSVAKFTFPATVKVKSYKAVNSQNIKLTWAKASNAEGYRVYIYDTSKKKWVSLKTLSGASNTSYTITGLTANTSYKFKVKAYRHGTKSTTWGISSDTFTAKTETVTLPSTPTIKSATKAKTSITLNWSKSSNAKGYRIYKYDTDKKKWVSVKTLSGQSNCSYTVTGLIEGTTYKFKVKAYTRDSAGYAVWGTSSSTYSVTTKQVTLPSTPSIKSTSTRTAATVTLKWSKSSNARGYRVYMYDTTNKKYVRVATLHGQSNCSYTITGLTPSTTYKFKVKAFTRNSASAAVWGTASSAYSIKTKSITLPSTPTIKSATKAKTSITLNWSKSSNAKGYRIYKYDTDKKKWVSVKTLSGQSNCSYTVTGLIEGTTYKFKVKAYTRDSAGYAVWGTSSSTYSVTTKQVTLPSTPSIKSTSTRTAATVTLKWSKSSNARGYRVYMYDTTNKKYVRVATLHGQSNCSYTITGLTPSTTYKFKVKAFTRNSASAAVWGTASSAYSIKTKSITLPSTPTISSASSTSSTVTLKWTKASNAEGYRIYKYDTNKKKWVKITTIYGQSNCSYTVTGLSSSTTYKFKVKAFTRDSAGCAVWGTSSAAKSATTK